MSRRGNKDNRRAKRLKYSQIRNIIAILGRHGCTRLKVFFGGGRYKYDGTDTKYKSDAARCGAAIGGVNELILYINACVRKSARTNRIARALVERLGESCTELRLADAEIAPLSEETLRKRTELIANKDYSDPMFDFAKQFAQADIIVISAPYWDYSFPSCLKVYLENIYVTGIVSEYGPDGMPHGLCKAKKLYYVTTAGGPYLPDFSYDYFKALATTCFGIPRTALIKAEMLDVDGFDAEKIVEQTIRFVGNIEKAETTLP